MTKKKSIKIVVALSLVLLLTLGAVYFVVPYYKEQQLNFEEKQLITHNTAELQKSIYEKCDGYRIVSLTSLTPFEWDTAYFFDAYANKEHIYEKVGYKWANVRTGIDESSTNMVFLLNGKVVCHVYGKNATYHLRAPNEIYARDDPKFMVYLFVGDSPALTFLDTGFVGKYHPSAAPTNLVGRWEALYAIGKNATAGANFTLTEEGILNGRIRFEAEGHTGSGQASFTGALINSIAYCQTYSTVQMNPTDKSSHVPVNFQMVLQASGEFLLRVDFSRDLHLTLIDGTPIFFDGEYLIKKEA